MDDLETRIAAAAIKRRKKKEAFLRANAELRALLKEARAAGRGPSHLARLTGLTREWITKVAPGPPSG